MKVRAIKILTILLLLTITTIGCQEKKPPISPSGRVVKIGVIGPMSGPQKALGRDALMGIQTSLHLNPYLKNGDKIQLIIKDDQNKSEITVKEFKDLVQKQKVSALLLLSSSSPCLAVKAMADTFKTPVLAVLGTHPKITEKTKFVSQLCFDNIFQGKVAALFVYDELLIDKAAVLANPNSYYSSSLGDEFVKQFMRIGGDITDIKSVTEENNDFRAILKKIREHKPELIYLPVDARYAIPIMKAMRGMGWYPECMAGEGLISEIVSQYEDDIHLFDGTLAVGFFSNSIPLTPRGKKAIRTFRKLFSQRGNSFVALGVEGMDILRNAMNRCDKPQDKICVNEKLRSTKNFEGLMGKISIQLNGKASRPLIVNRFKNGKIYGVVRVY